MERELEIIARRKGELQARYDAAKSKNLDTTTLEEEARQLLAYEAHVVKSGSGQGGATRVSASEVLSNPGSANTVDSSTLNAPAAHLSVPLQVNDSGTTLLQQFEASQAALSGAHVTRKPGSVAEILCCNCGILCEANDSRLCLSCLEEEGGIADAINENLSVSFCKSCSRYEHNQGQWLPCEWESKELLALCLKKIRKPKHIRLVDAKFIWTESHCRRIKVQITVEGEIERNVLVRQQKLVTFVVACRQCEQCCQSVTPHTWVSNIQVRQRSSVKRTMLYLEQLVLKHQAHDRTTEVVDTPDGMDFHFMKPQDASAFVNFVRSHLPCKVSNIATQLVSHNANSNLYRNKYVQIIDIAPVNREDLVYIPKKVSHHYLGGIHQFVKTDERNQYGQSQNQTSGKQSCSGSGNTSLLLLCVRISSGVRFINPFTLQLVDLDAEKYFKLSGNTHTLNSSSGGQGGYLSGEGIRTLLTFKNLTEFMVLNHTPLQSPNLPGGRLCQKSSLARLELCKTSDLGTNDRYIQTITHLGSVIKSGDLVLGYDLTSSNLPDNDPDLNALVESVSHSFRPSSSPSLASVPVRSHYSQETGSQENASLGV